MAVVSSWLSLAWTLACFTRTDRNSEGERRTASFRHQVFDMTWRLAETGGRVLCIALFVSLFKFWLLAVLLPHGLLMFGWLYLQKKRDTSVITVLTYFVFAYVLQFCFINFSCAEHLRIRYIVFYVLFYAESFGMLLAWYLVTPDQGAWFHTWGLVGGLASLPLHVALQLLYYKCCHPSKGDIKTCIPCDWETWKLDIFY